MLFTGYFDRDMAAVGDLTYGLPTKTLVQNDLFQVRMVEYYTVVARDIRPRISPSW